MTGHIQMTYSTAVSFTTSATHVPFTGLPGGIAHGILVTANMTALELTLLDGTTVTWPASTPLLSTFIPIRCKTFKSTAGSFIAVQ